MNFKLFLLSIFILIGFSGTIYTTERLTLHSHSIVYHAHLDRVSAQGHTVLQLGSTSVTADHLFLYLNDNLVISSGNVVVTRGDESFSSTSLVMDLSQDAIQLTDISIYITPPGKTKKLSLTVAQLQDRASTKWATGTRLTSCLSPTPHYYLYSKKARYSPDKSIHIWGGYLRNDLSFFPFTLMPFPVPLIEWIPIPYYYYQLGSRKLVLNFPSIGQKKTKGWGWFVQNKIDFHYKNNKESSLFVDWYEATMGRSGEWGLGLLHHYGSSKRQGSLYVYNYNFKQDGEQKRNLIYEINQHVQLKNTNISGFIKRVDVDERINSTGSSDSLRTSVTILHDPHHFPFSINYSSINSYSSRYDTNLLTIKKKSLHHNSSLVTSRKFYSQSQREVLSSSLSHQVTLHPLITLDHRLSLFEQDYKTDAVDADQHLTYTSSLYTQLPNDISLSIHLDYLHDLDQDRVTTDQTTGQNNYLYKLPEIILKKKGKIFTQLPVLTADASSTVKIGYYREVRYLADNPSYSMPHTPGFLEPNVYYFKQSLNKQIQLPSANTHIHFSSGYEQYVFKSKHVGLFEGDAQYSLNYSGTIRSTFFSFIKLTSSYTRSHAHKNNNSPFFAFRKSFLETNRLSESLLFFYKTPASKPHAVPLDIQWKHSAGYNWVKQSNPYTDYHMSFDIRVHRRYHLGMKFSKKLNENWHKDNRPFSPLLIKLDGKTKSLFRFNYSLSFDLNDIVFSDTYTVNYSSLNIQFPLGKDPDFQWNIKAYFNYQPVGHALIVDGYRFQSISVVKQEHERQLEFGYHKNTNELFFKFVFKMFPEDPIVLRKKGDVVKFEGRLTQSSKERFK